MKTIYTQTDVTEIRPYRLQYSVKEAAYMLSSSERTVNEWIRTGKLESYKIGGKGKNFIRHDEICRFVDEESGVRSFVCEIYGLETERS